ncbi:MAG: acyl-CoA dehydrogenase family protein [Desulfobacterales bacterium]|nr:acyl-CoA dehydrogenase family protein [Desulfobacterales bacterium]
MDFELSKEHRAIRDAAREFAQKEIAPVAHEHDRNHHFPRDIISKMGELGFFGCLIPEEYGGTDYGFMGMVLITEEVSRFSSSIRGAINMQCTGTAYNILKNGSAEQKQKYIPPLITAEKLGCFAMTEPNAGSDTLSMETYATYENGEYILNGTKTWISYATVADITILYAYTDPDARAKGLSAFILEMNSPGVSTSEIDKLGTHSFPSGEIALNNVRVPQENLLGGPGEGARILFGSLPDTRIGCTAGAVGLAQACLDEAIKYCKTRTQFGQAIGNFQMNQALIADVAMNIEAARLLLYRAAWQKDQGVKNNVLETSYAKMFAANVVVQAATVAMDVHGAYGYSTEYPASRYYRDAKMYQIVEGTTNIHRLIIGLDRLGIRKANR